MLQTTNTIYFLRQILHLHHKKLSHPTFSTKIPTKKCPPKVPPVIFLQRNVPKKVPTSIMTNSHTLLCLVSNIVHQNERGGVGGVCGGGGEVNRFSENFNKIIHFAGEDVPSAY